MKFCNNKQSLGFTLFTACMTSNYYKNSDSEKSFIDCTPAAQIAGTVTRSKFSSQFVFVCLHVLHVFCVPASVACSLCESQLLDIKLASLLVPHVSLAA